MTSPNDANIREVSLPFSNGLISAKLWRAYGKYVVGVPSLGIHCYGRSEQEAAFRLFTSLLKYYRQLKSNQESITDKGKRDFGLLSEWVGEIEKKMTAPNTVMTNRPVVVSMADRRPGNPL